MTPATPTRTVPRTLLDLSGATIAPASFADGVLVVIDAQSEYRSGRLPLAGIDPALTELSGLLASARANGTPVVHVIHHGRPGGPLFDPDGPGSAFLPGAEPVADEAVVIKHLPNAFTDTALEPLILDRLQRCGRRSLILAGFMTHNCVSATARAALDRRLPVTIVASATATRDLPAPLGGIVPAAQVQSAELAALADRTAVIVPDGTWL